MAQPKVPTAYLPLSPRVFHLLLALVEGEQHGYAIMKEVAERSEGTVKIGPGTLYEAIARMVRDGVIEESDQRPDPDRDDRRRRYYRLTNLGDEIVRAESRRLAGLVRFARSRDLLSERAE